MPFLLPKLSNAPPFSCLRCDQLLLQPHKIEIHLKQGTQIPHARGECNYTPLQNPGPGRRAPNVLGKEGAHFLRVANTRKSHLVHNFRVVLCQNHRHRVRNAREFDGVRVLPILLVTQDEARPLVLLIVQRTTGGPANAPQPQKVGLVHILKDRQGHKAAQQPPHSIQPLLLPREALPTKTHSPASTHQPPPQGLPLNSAPHNLAPRAYSSTSGCQAIHKPSPYISLLSPG